MLMEIVCTEEVCVVEVSYAAPKGPGKAVERVKESVIDHMAY